MEKLSDGALRPMIGNKDVVTGVIAYFKDGNLEGSEYIMNNGGYGAYNNLYLMVRNPARAYSNIQPVGKEYQIEVKICPVEATPGGSNAQPKTFDFSVKIRIDQM